MLGVEYSGLSYYQLGKEQLMAEKRERDKKTAGSQNDKGTDSVSEFFTSEGEAGNIQGTAAPGNLVKDAWKEYWEAYYDRMKNEILENFYKMALDEPKEEKRNEQMKHREDEGLFSEKPLEASDDLKTSDGLMGILENRGKKSTSDNSQVLGIGFLENPQDGVMYGMSARFSENSTSENPIIQVTVMTAGKPEEHEIYINQVDVRNATEIEMFALCNYLDATGHGTGGTFGTWQTLNYFRQNASDNGYFHLSNQMDTSDSLRQNWFSMVVQMNRDYKEAGLFAQVKDGRALMEALREHMNSMYIDGRLAGEEPSFSIGAGSYTEEEWDEFLRHVDLMLTSVPKEDGKNGREAGSSVLDGMPVESLEDTAVNTVADDSFLLTSESSRCSYPSDRKGEQIHYIVCYTQDGIICNRVGEKEAVWQLSFENEGDYDRVMDFLSQFDSEENLRFAAHKNFWQDFLAGNLNEGEFLDFYAGAEDGMPGYLLTIKDGAYVDKKSIEYQKYFTHNAIANPESQLPDFVGEFYKDPSEIFSYLDDDLSWKREFGALSEVRRKGWGYR